MSGWHGQHRDHWWLTLAMVPTGHRLHPHSRAVVNLKSPLNSVHNRLIMEPLTYFGKVKSAGWFYGAFWSFEKVLTWKCSLHRSPQLYSSQSTHKKVHNIENFKYIFLSCQMFLVKTAVSYINTNKRTRHKMFSTEEVIYIFQTSITFLRLIRFFCHITPPPYTEHESHWKSCVLLLHLKWLTQVSGINRHGLCLYLNHVNPLKNR